MVALLTGEGTEPAVRGGGGRRRLPQVVEGWTRDVEDLLPWVPGPADSEDRMTRLLVALRGYSTEGGRGGLMGRLSELVEAVEAALAGRVSVRTGRIWLTMGPGPTTRSRAIWWCCVRAACVAVSRVEPPQLRQTDSEA